MKYLKLFEELNVQNYSVGDILLVDTRPNNNVAGDVSWLEVVRITGIENDLLNTDIYWSNSPKIKGTIIGVRSDSSIVKKLI